MVVAGTSNYNSPEMKQVSAAGGTVLVYVDALIDNATGRYATMLLQDSACGAAVPRWPGNISANTWGYLTDFRVGGVLQGKLACVLEKIVAENPHIGGFFADDLGTRSWFPNINWDTFGASNQLAYRNGAIGLSQTFRSVADKHGLFFMVNGTWAGGSVATSGGGYPDANQSGNALADGAFAEHHDANEFWGHAYPCASQWADAEPDHQGNGVQLRRDRHGRPARRHGPDRLLLVRGHAVRLRRRGLPVDVLHRDRPALLREERLVTRHRSTARTHLASGPSSVCRRTDVATSFTPRGRVRQTAACVPYGTRVPVSAS